MIQSRGFSLVELLVAIAIVAILASIALPRYDEVVNRARRADAKAFLMQLSSDQEAFYAQNFSYANSITAAGQLDYADALSPESHYTAVLNVQPGGCAAGAVACRTYSFVLTPNFADPRCTTITYAGNGTRGNTGTGTVEDCWR
jgi:type IV pilus assembly protein PilE